jgi:acyl-CoA thioester hydrolase
VTDDIAPPQARDGYRYFLRIPTRWMDNDIYGHVNNVVYYSYFDTVINTYLIERGGLDIQAADGIVGITPETHCNFRDSFSFPETVEAGLSVGRLGARSVKYLIGLFKEGAETPAATGWFVHVFVDRTTLRPVEAMPQRMREALEGLKIEG